MDSLFAAHNFHLKSISSFIKNDPHLLKLATQKLVFSWPLLEKLPNSVAGIYSLGGGRQIGKTTLLKLWMRNLLTVDKINPKSLVFFSGEIIDDQHSLLRILQDHLLQMPDGKKFIIIDEITYIKNWDKAIKYAADLGWFNDAIVFITGSDLLLIQEAKMRFPGRRGRADKVDFHLYPLSFKDTLCLKKIIHDPANNSEIENVKPNILINELYNYLQHGGFLTAINDFAKYNKILDSTYATYTDWIRGDILKRGKSDNYLQEILSAVIKTYGSQVSYNALSRELSIEHPNTVSDYINTLSSMDAIFIQSALLEDKLKGAPKKAKKIIFTDPFIYNAVNSWLKPTENNYQTNLDKINEDPLLASKLIEATTCSHYMRCFPTFYIKSSGEVDIAYVENNRFWPIEIKWTNQLRTKDLKQISKYNNGKILTKNPANYAINGVPTEFLPIALAKII